jgi:hypothetical protein
MILLYQKVALSFFKVAVPCYTYVSNIDSDNLCYYVVVIQILPWKDQLQCVGFDIVMRGT